VSNYLSADMPVGKSVYISHACLSVCLSVFRDICPSLGLSVNTTGGYVLYI